MKKLIALIMACSAATAVAQDSVKTRVGELKIEGSMYEPKLTLNGQVISTGEFIYGFPEQTKHKFDVNGAEVVLVADAVSATCQMYFFVTLTNGKPPAKTASFGNCNDNPQATQDGKTITIRLGSKKGGKVYKYTDGKVS